MKIAEIGAKKIPSREGGIDVVVQKLSTFFALMGNQVTCFVSRNAKEDLKIDNLSVIKLPTIHKKATEAVIYSFLATRRVRKNGYDVIHFHGEGNCLFLKKLRKSHSKIIVTIHGLDWKRGKFKGLGSKLLLQSEKQIVRYADVIITLSRSDHDYLRQKYGRESVIIPNGFEQFQDVPPTTIFPKFGLTKNGYYLYLARIVPEKGLHYLIQAYKNTEAWLENKKLVIAGSSSYSDKYFQEIMKLVGNDTNIIFTGFAEGRTLQELFSNAFYYVLPSDIEGMPLSLIEALGYKKTCIASDIPENHLDDGNILFFQHGNIPSLQEKLQQSIKRGNSFDESTICIPSWDNVCTQTLNLYKS
jgi:glycosyltransferase involved in cell wall biosynthesis